MSDSIEIARALLSPGQDRGAVPPIDRTNTREIERTLRALEAAQPFQSSSETGGET